MLSTTKYAARCVWGTEIFYILCLLYGFFLSGKEKELHLAFFELIPGFVWGNVLRMLWGGVFWGSVSWITGWYIAWMHNVCLVSPEDKNSNVSI